MPHGRGTTTSMHIDVIAVSASNVWPAIRHHHHQFSRYLSPQKAAVISS